MATKTKSTEPSPKRPVPDQLAPKETRKTKARGKKTTIKKASTVRKEVTRDPKAVKDTREEVSSSAGPAEHDVVITKRPERRTGEAEIAKRKTPDKNKSRPEGRLPDRKQKAPAAAKASGDERTLELNGRFKPGTKVTLHHEHAEDVARSSGHAPFSKSVAGGKVTNAGQLKVKAEPGTYVVTGEVERESNPGQKTTSYEYLTVHVA